VRVLRAGPSNANPQEHPARELGCHLAQWLTTAASESTITDPKINSRNEKTRGGQAREFLARRARQAARRS
jgi:hypothetical protein